MAGYVLHMIHGYETYKHLSDATKAEMPKDALRKFIIGEFIPDLATREKKQRTHFYKKMKTGGTSYYVPDMNMANILFRKKDPTNLGVLAHLKCDFDYVKNVLLVYAKPIGNEQFQKTQTGEILTKAKLFGDGKEIRGQLYELYDKFNEELALRYMGAFNSAFCTNFAEDKNGFLSLIKWLFPDGIPRSGITEMDDYRMLSDINNIFEELFRHDGKNCKLNIEIDDVLGAILKSAIEMSNSIDALYSNEESSCWEEVVKALEEKRLTISTMESCTGGGIANEITNISGASSVLKESYVTYSNEAKIKHGVSAEVVKMHSVYGPETAVEMANAVKKLAKSNISVGVTGQLGRIDPNNPVDKLNFVWFAVSNQKGGVFVIQIEVPDVQRKIQKEYVLNEIAKTILKAINS